MNSLLIDQIEIYKMPIALYEPFVISLGPQYNADNILIIIRTNEGISGFGECSPYMSINGESMDTCFIVAQYLAQALKGKNALQIDERTTDMNKVIFGNNSIKSAFDMALYDVAAQYNQLPLYKFLGGEKNKIITTDMTVGINSVEKMTADAVKFKANGFPAIKVKLGTGKENDVQIIKSIRATVGNEMPLRIDANQGWSVPEAIETLQELVQFNIEHCEEPISRWNFLQLPFVRKNSPIKIMADESCSTYHDAGNLASINACDYFNIKLGKSGGIFNAMKMVQIAKAHQIKMQVGSFMESRLATTAFVHFAYADASIVHFDLDTPLMLAHDPIIGGVQYKQNGVVEIDEGCGMGVRIDENYLNSLERFVVK